jgi:hypothetical protein
MSSNQETNKDFNALLEEYNLSKVALATNPHGNHDNGYNRKAHKFAESIKGPADLVLAKLLLAKSSEIKFATVDVIEGVYYVTYNPYGSWLDDLKEMTYDIIEPLAVKPKSIKIYNAANGNKLKWLVKIMTGNIFNFFIFKLEKWLIEDTYKKTMKDFSKAVAIMIKYNPHIECYKYAVYIANFVEWMQTFEEDIICIQTIVDGIYENLQSVFFPKDAKKYKEEGIILEKINNAPAHLSWQDCAKSCNDQFSKLDFKIEKHVNFLDMIKKRAEEAKKQKDDKINSLKRKSDAIKTESEDDPKKKMKKSEEEEKSSAETAEPAEPSEN